MTDQITIPRALLEQAMNALLLPCDRWNKQQFKIVTAAAEAIRAELAKPVEPVEPAAWRTFDGEGGYMFRAYEDNEDYQEWFEKRNPHHKGWVEPLYLHPPTPAWHDAPTEPGLWFNSINHYADIVSQHWIDRGVVANSHARWYGPIPQDTKAEGEST